MATPTVFTPFAIDPIQLGTSVGDVYTAGSGGALVDSLCLVNDTTTPVTATLHYVPSGGTAGDDNIICEAINVPADGHPVWILTSDRKLHMEASGKIRGLASAASQVTVHCGGVDFA